MQQLLIYLQHTNIATLFSKVITNTTFDSATFNNINADSSDIRQVSTEFINFDSAFGDSATTITNIANSVLTGKTATLDSVDSSNIAITNS